MFDFQDNKSQKRYGWVKRGWHIARIHQPSLKNSRVGNQYIKIDFEIIQEEECRDILVPGFFNYNRNGKADPRFLDMGKAAGLRENYGDDLNSVFHDLLGKELPRIMSPSSSDHGLEGGSRALILDPLLLCNLCVTFPAMGMLSI